MVLEASVICLDNSDWMRNGDYNPTRMEAQHDAVNLISSAKTQQNPESTVAVVACAGRTPEVLVTLTSDLGKVLQSLHGIKVTGSLNFQSGLQVAQLVLKHRQNKNQHQRIIFFVGSPIEANSDELVKLAKRLKKNNIAVDIVNFGEQEANTEKLEAFIGAVNNNDNSHLVNVPPGPHILSDILITSPIVAGEEYAGGGSAPATGGANDFSAYGGVDPSLDPELALALKISMEEARARQESEKKTEGGEGAPTTTEQGASSSSTSTGATQETEMGEAMDDEEAMLARAIAMSMQAEQQPSSTSSTTTTTSAPATTSATSTSKDIDMQDLGEEDELKLALQMSMQQQGGGSEDISKFMEDPNFVSSVLSSLPGVDPSDETLKSLLANLAKPKSDEEKEDKEKKDKQ